MPGGLPVAGSKPGGYVPPSRRAGAGEGDSMRRREENSVRVTNLSEDTREDDLRARPRPPAHAIEQAALPQPGSGDLRVQGRPADAASPQPGRPQVLADRVSLPRQLSGERSQLFGCCVWCDSLLK